jgi:uncharacterized protein (TIGR00255 family)
MIRRVASMTGFGKGEAASESLRFDVEIRSVNHRFCDVGVKIPRLFSALEDRVRRRVRDCVSRGKVDVFVTYAECAGKSKRISIDLPLAESYYQAFTQLKQHLNLPGELSVSLFMHYPDILRVETGTPDEDQAWEVLREALDMALEALLDMRGREGEKLAADLMGKFSAIREATARLEARAPSVVSEYRARLAARVKELLGQNALDENRLAAEVAIFAERCSVDEEIARLKSHLEQAEKSCASNQPAGRKLDFIIQEINREVNTIGSKSNDLDMNTQVVEIKSELEKIREQVQNLE